MRTLTRTLIALSLSLVVAACSSPPPPPQRVEVNVGDHGYAPAEVSVEAGRPLTLVFTRTSESPCGQEVVFPSLDLHRQLPLNEAVTIDLPPQTQPLAFTCGMNMMKGSVVVAPAGS